MRALAAFFGFAALVASGFSTDLSRAVAAEKPKQAWDADEVLDQFVSCWLGGLSAKQRKLFDAPVGARATQAALNGSIDSACMREDHSGSFPALVLRGAAFQFFYRRDLGARPPIDSFDGVAPVAYPALPEAEQSAPSAYPDVAKTYSQLMKVGDCVAHQAPLAARALVMSTRKTPAEKAALDAILPTLSGCMVEGASVTFSREILRGAIAEPLYRLGRAKVTA